MSTAKAAGYAVTISRKNPATGRSEAHVFGARTRFPSVALKRAQLKHGFIRTINIEPLSATHYAARFPEGKKGKRRMMSLIRN